MVGAGIKPLISLVANIVSAIDAVVVATAVVIVGGPNDIWVVHVSRTRAHVVLRVLHRIGRLGLVLPYGKVVTRRAIAVVVVARLDALFHGKAGRDPAKCFCAGMPSNCV